jgi:hypothetical protein
MKLLPKHSPAMLLAHFVGEAARRPFVPIRQHWNARVSRIGFNPGHEARLIERSIAAPTIGFHALKGQ